MKGTIFSSDFCVDESNNEVPDSVVILPKNPDESAKKLYLPRHYGYKKFGMPDKNKLKDDKFYKLCSETTLKRYEKHHSEKAFLEHMSDVFN